MTPSQLPDQSLYSRGQVLTRDFNTLRSLIVHVETYREMFLNMIFGLFRTLFGGLARGRRCVGRSNGHRPPSDTTVVTTAHTHRERPPGQGT